MATVSQGLAGRLTAFAGLTALVGTRIYPGVLPQDQAPPAVVYERLEASRESAMGTDTDLVATFFRVTSVGGTYDEAEAVHEQVRKALQRWRGTSNGITVHDILLRSEVGPDFADDPPTWEAFVDVEVRHTEA